MARIRSVHPGFFTDEDLVEVSAFARLLFIGIGTEADDKGIFEWKPSRIKMRVFPADNLDVSELLNELESVGTIKSYEIDGRKYGAIRNFRKFQKPKTPNDIHPITDDFRIFVGLKPTNYENDQVKKDQFPPKGEKPIQMEDGGCSKEDVLDINSSFQSELTPPEKPDNSKIEIAQAFEAYNLAANENDWAVCQKISKARNSQMRARLKDCGGIDGFMACLEKCKASDFLQGRVSGSNGTFQLGIDFILKDSSFTKIMEGNYDNRKQPEKQKSMSSASMFFEAARQAEGLSQ